MTFDQWMRQVDEIVWEQAGCGINDLPDCLFKDWYEDRVSPEEAAARAVEEA